MFEVGGCESDGARVETTTEGGGTRERRQRFDVVDLFEELLSRRADLGFRPVLFVSSERDLECSLIGMFEGEGAKEAPGEAVPQGKTLDDLRRRLG